MTQRPIRVAEPSRPFRAALDGRPRKQAEAEAEEYRLDAEFVVTGGKGGADFRAPPVVQGPVLFGMAIPGERRDDAMVNEVVGVVEARCLFQVTPGCDENLGTRKDPLRHQVLVSDVSKPHGYVDPLFDEIDAVRIDADLITSG